MATQIPPVMVTSNSPTWIDRERVVNPACRHLFGGSLTDHIFLGVGIEVAIGVNEFNPRDFAEEFRHLHQGTNLVGSSLPGGALRR